VLPLFLCELAFSDVSSEVLPVPSESARARESEGERERARKREAEQKRDERERERETRESGRKGHARERARARETERERERARTRAERARARDRESQEASNRRSRNGHCLRQSHLDHLTEMMRGLCRLKKTATLRPSRRRKTPTASYLEEARLPFSSCGLSGSAIIASSPRLRLCGRCPPPRPHGHDWGHRQAERCAPARRPASPGRRGPRGSPILCRRAGPPSLLTP